MKRWALVLLAMVMVGAVGCGGGGGGSSTPDDTALVGTWSWFNGGTVYFEADGTARGYMGAEQIDSCTWKLMDAADRWYQLTWQSGWVDQLTLSADGNSLAGYNQAGNYVTGERLY